MTGRAHISFKTKYAACVARILQIPHDHQEIITEDQMISLAHVDHYPRRKADGGSDRYSNLYVRSIMAHREKTATIDQPQIAKQKRIRLAESAHKVAMLEKYGLDDGEN